MYEDTRHTTDHGTYYEIQRTLSDLFKRRGNIIHPCVGCCEVGSWSCFGCDMAGLARGHAIIVRHIDLDIHAYMDELERRTAAVPF